MVRLTQAPKRHLISSDCGDRLNFGEVSLPIGAVHVPHSGLLPSTKRLLFACLAKSPPPLPKPFAIWRNLMTCENNSNWRLAKPRARWCLVKWRGWAKRASPNSSPSAGTFSEANRSRQRFLTIFVRLPLWPLLH